VFRVLIVTTERKRLEEFAAGLAGQPDVELSWAGSGNAAIAMVKSFPPMAVVIDEELLDMTGLELVKRILPINAMISTVILSELEPEAFHEAAEGLGIAARMPPQPTAEEATRLLHRLKKLAFPPPTP
jgi:DNA-binding response OmpR family regulator